MVYIIVAFALVVGAYFLFRDTMNKIQYIEHLRIYWITRDTGGKGDKIVTRAFMRQVDEPFWRGKGVQVRVGKHTFQTGLLTHKVPSLRHQISNMPDYSVPVEELRRDWLRKHLNDS